jgi:hypothetical protein
MPEESAETKSRIGALRLRRLRLPVLVAGLVLIVLGTPALTVVALVTKADWALIAAIMAFAVGLFLIVRVIAPPRASGTPQVQVMIANGELLLTPDVVLRFEQSQEAARKAGSPPDGSDGTRSHPPQQ